MTSTPPTPGERNTEFRDLAGHFKEVLLAATRERPKREAYERTASGEEIGWVVYERRQMLDAVNAALAVRGLPGVPLAEVERVEQQAVGHSDYVAQWAYGCARIVQGASLAQNGPAPLP